MKSLFLRQLSRHCLRKPSALVVNDARFLSGSPLCHIVGAEHCGSSSRDGDIGKLVICNFSACACGTKQYFLGDLLGRKTPYMNYTEPGGGKELLEKTVPMELMKERGTIGASHGWVATLKDGIVCLQDDLNPSASDSDPKRISLPPLVTLPQCQTEVVTNVAMSSSSPEDDDCIVAVKFLGPQLSLCWLGQRNPKWVNIRIEDPGFFSSQVMYSKKDDMFSMPCLGGLHKGSWDLDKHISHNLQFPSYPKFNDWEWESLLPCHRTEHLVESPTGRTFLVKWYTYCVGTTGRSDSKRFLVFEIFDKEEVAMYTTDIGDLCIFLSMKGESFCLQASLYDLSPNYIYHLSSHGHGKYDIGHTREICGSATYPAPYFIPPHS